LARPNDMEKGYKIWILDNTEMDLKEWLSAVLDHNQMSLVRIQLQVLVDKAIFQFVIPYHSIRWRYDVNILGGRSIGHLKQKSVYVQLSYSERFPR
jgi:hypothetical protein